MKNKIYSKLFKFVDVKSWSKSAFSSSSILESNFYPEYKLELKCDDFGWFYKVYRGKYSSTIHHSGLITLNKGGKTLFTICLSLVLVMTLILGFNITNYKIHIAIVLGSYILSFFAFSIFNWSIYLSLRKAQYYIRNAGRIKEKEELELLRQEIIGVVNKKIESNPKLARKTKLLQLKKKSFLEKLFDKEE